MDTKEKFEQALAGYRASMKDLGIAAKALLEYETGFTVGDVIQTKAGKKICVKITHAVMEDTDSGAVAMWKAAFRGSKKVRLIRDPESWTKIHTDENKG